MSVEQFVSCFMQLDRLHFMFLKNCLVHTNRHDDEPV